MRLAGQASRSAMSSGPNGRACPCFRNGQPRWLPHHSS
jgi:hypothetical protein